VCEEFYTHTTLKHTQNYCIASELAAEAAEC